MNLIRLAILYVQYDPKKYGNSFPVLEEYLKRLWCCGKTFYVIDNKNEGNHVEELAENVFKIGGDNSEREFSGWQKGLDFLESQKIGYDVILFANEAFEAPGKSFLQDYAMSALLKSFFFTTVVGRIDSMGKELAVLNYLSKNWICTNCLFVPRKIIRKLGSVLSVDSDRINLFIDREWKPPANAVLGKETLRARGGGDGNFVVEAQFPENKGSFPIEILSSRSFIPWEQGLGGDGRTLAFIVKNVEIDGGSTGEVEKTAGWYPEEEGACWISDKATACIRNAERGGRLRIEGYVPENVLREIYDNSLEIMISGRESFFKTDAPIAEDYKELIIEWLTTRWHSKFEVNEVTWGLLRQKVKAILNEFLLTARIREQGFSVSHYGKKLYY